MVTFRTRSRGVILWVGLFLSTQALAGPLIINEFRVRGPNGANDEYIEIYNPGPTAHTVAAISGTGYGVAASDGTTRFSIPNGTMIPAGGHYLGVNSIAYSLASYPAGNGTTATGDATYTTDIPDNAGIALFNNNTGGGSYTLANRMDAVGSSSEANALYKEGTGYPALTPFSIDYAFYRDDCGKGGSITAMGPCPSAGMPIDTDNNAADFVFVDTNGTSAGAGQRLGAPGPENLTSPISLGTDLAGAGLDSCSPLGNPPNFVRDFTSDPANNSTFGTVDHRFTFTNNTGGNLTRLRFRIIDLSTFPAPSGIADLRPRTSSPVVVTVDRPPCGSGTSNVQVQGTTLEQPPSQPNGGGFNSSWSAPIVSQGTPLANGSSVDLRFLLGVQQTGNYKLGILPEMLPAGGLNGSLILLECTTNGGCVQIGPPGGSTTFLVSKDFDDNNPAEVQVTLSCNTGLPLQQTTTISEGEPVNFVIGDFEPGTLNCAVTEAVPVGYTASYNDGTVSPQNCEWANITNGAFFCAITNALDPVEVEVSKVWIDENPQFEAQNIADAVWECSSTNQGATAGQLDFFGNPGTDSFLVFPDWQGGTHCSVTEVSVQDSGVEVDDSDCQNLVLVPGSGGSCTIYNTRLYQGIPTLSQYGLILLTVFMLGIGLLGVRKLTG